MEDFNYDNVKNKYEDSISQNDFDAVFSNTEKHGELNFEPIKEEFLDFYSMIFQLEKFNYRDLLYEAEVKQVDNIRDQTHKLFEQITGFSIFQPNSAQVRESLINQVKSLVNSHAKILEDYILKLKTKRFFDSSEGKEAFQYIEEEKQQIEKEKVKIQKITDEVEEYRDKLKQKIENTEFEKIASTERVVGEAESANFFEEQADKHSQNAENETDGWLGQRVKFEKYIYRLLGISAGLFLASFLTAILVGGISDKIKIDDALELWKSFWDLRAGLFVASFLAIFYTGLYFSTQNYSKEKSYQYQNKNKANITKTVGLFSSGASPEIRSNIYNTASQTIFAPYDQQSNKEQKSADINLSASSADVIKKVNGQNDS